MHTAAAFSVTFMRCPAREKNRSNPQVLVQRKRNPVPRNTVRDLTEAGVVFYCDPPMAFRRKDIMEEVERRIGREVNLVFGPPQKKFGSWFELWIEPPGNRRPRYIHAIRMKFFEVF